MPSSGKRGTARQRTSSANLVRAPRAARKAPDQPPAPTRAAPARLVVLTEPPHAHIVCRQCGRIAQIPLDTQSELRLEELAGARPDGWTVDLIAYSITGACVRCREGAAPG